MSTASFFPILFLLVGYFLGAIPFAVIVAKRHGIDILKAGSGNPGATNVKRCCGKKAGNAVFVFDALKGFFAAFLPFILLKICAGTAENLLGNAENADYILAISQISGFAGAILGHCFSIFLKFKGGKGVSTTIGALFGAMPIAILAALPVWLIFYFWTKIVAIASIAFGLFLPLAVFLLMKFVPAAGYNCVQFLFCCVLAIFILVMHQSNIRRLLKGEENSFSKKKK